MLAHDYIDKMYQAMNLALQTGSSADWQNLRELFDSRPKNLRHVKLLGLKQVALIYTLATQNRLPRSYSRSFAGINIQTVVDQYILDFEVQSLTAIC